MEIVAGIFLSLYNVDKRDTLRVYFKIGMCIKSADKTNFMNRFSCNCIKNKRFFYYGYSNYD